MRKRGRVDALPLFLNNQSPIISIIRNINVTTEKTVTPAPKPSAAKELFGNVGKSPDATQNPSTVKVESEVHPQAGVEGVPAKGTSVQAAPSGEAVVAPVPEQPKNPGPTPHDILAHELNRMVTEPAKTAGEKAPGSTEGLTDEEIDQPKSNLDYLKRKADLMGIGYASNIGEDALRKKINDKIDGSEKHLPTIDPELKPVIDSGVSAKTAMTLEEAKRIVAEAQLAEAKDGRSNYQKQYDEQMRLVRVRITNMDPRKKDLPGEIFTVANRVLGVVKKFIPYGEQTDNGYHIPYILYNALKERVFTNIKTRKGSNGRIIVETNDAREFALEVLPPLTEKELAALAAQQGAADGMD
jgi:hypothetical protein